MDNGGDILRLCRLCLVKDDVNIPIFEGQGDIRQIFLKISSCLPVKVSREDQLPKKICDGCSYKLDMLYEFWNTTANAEKQLLTWLGEAGMNAKLADAVAQQIKPAETFVKQEAIDPSDVHTEDDDDKSYMFQQKFTIEEDGPSATVTSNEEPPPKRARRTAAVKAQIAMDPESDDDDDSGEPVTKVEDESDESDGDDNDASFADAPSTSADDQPGPSGVGKDGVEAPLLTSVQPGWRLYDQSVPFSSPQQPSVSEELVDCFVQKLETSSTEIIIKIEPNVTYICTKCGKLHTSEKDLFKHEQAAHGCYRCQICRKVFADNSLLEVHHSVHDPSRKNVECPICSKKISVSHYRTHKRWHENIDKKLFICGKCNKPFISSAYLKEHEQVVHLRNYRYSCDKCGKKYQTRCKLLKHDLNKHQVIPSECPVCKRVFDRGTSLRRHLRYHQPRYEKLKCPVCKKVVSAHTLKIHEKKHVKEAKRDKSCICDVCGKSVTDLPAHMRTHTGEKPFCCDYCGKCFTTKPTLVCHKRTHTKERPFICKICGKGFTQHSPLKRHMRQHTGEKPSKCPICSKNFGMKDLLNGHNCSGPS